MRVEIQKPRENRDFTARGALARRISTRLKSLISHPSIREASFLAGFRACPPRERLHLRRGSATGPAWLPRAAEGACHRVAPLLQIPRQSLGSPADSEDRREARLRSEYPTQDRDRCRG